MKLLIFSDIHGDKAALEKLMAIEADYYFAAGDLVNWARGLDKMGEVLKRRASKMYVLPDNHGSGVSTALMDAALAAAAEWGAGCVWLGVNQKNERAQQFYKRCGFTVNGTRSFRLGAHTESDYVMLRPLDAAKR